MPHGTLSVKYSVGFLVSEDGSRVLLLEKGRPAWLRGQWNGIGGHIERGESAFEAMLREAAEEAALPALPWTHLGVINAQEHQGAPLGTAQLVVFAARGPIDAARALTDEPIRAFAWEELEHLPLSATTRLALPHVRAFAENLAPTDFHPPTRNPNEGSLLYGVRLATSVWGVRQSHEVFDTLAATAPDTLTLMAPVARCVPPARRRFG